MIKLLRRITPRHNTNVQLVTSQRRLGFILIPICLDSSLDLFFNSNEYIDSQIKKR